MSALPTLKQLQYLVALSAQLNFTRAAEACFVPIDLSAGLKELEDILGAQLVERDRQSVLMTPIGLDIAARARDIVAATQDLADRAAGSRNRCAARCASASSRPSRPSSCRPRCASCASVTRACA